MQLFKKHIFRKKVKKNIKFLKKCKKLELNLIVCRIISLFRNQEYCSAYAIKYNLPKIIYPIDFFYYTFKILTLQYNFF